MTLFPDDGDRGVSPAIALYSILGFWLFYTVLVSLRAAVVGFDSQMEMAARRMVVAVIGIIITWILYLVLRRFDQRPLALRVVAAFSLAAPFALAMAATSQRDAASARATTASARVSMSRGARALFCDRKKQSN